jgi:WD40 repeat protein
MMCGMICDIVSDHTIWRYTVSCRVILRDIVSAHTLSEQWSWSCLPLLYAPSSISGPFQLPVHKYEKHFYFLHHLYLIAWFSLKFSAFFHCYFAAIWDANKGVRTRKLVDHSGIVNSCSIARVSTKHHHQLAVRCVVCVVLCVCYVHCTVCCVLCVWCTLCVLCTVLCLYLPCSSAVVRPLYAPLSMSLSTLQDKSTVTSSSLHVQDNHQIFASGSDDCTAIVWDQRSKKQLQSIYHDYQVTAVCMAADGNSLYTGGLDSIIR